MSDAPSGVKVQLGSIFRDSAEYLPRYLNQVEKAVEQVGVGRLLWLEGDSSDRTYEVLRMAAVTFRERGVDVHLVKYDTGRPYYPSIDNALRWRHLEEVWNRCLAEYGDADFSVTVESDLIWEADVLGQCVERLERGIADVVYPCLMHGYSANWYDTHGFSRCGKKFRARAPYCEGWNESDHYIDVETGGGMVVARGAAMKQATWANGCIVTFPAGYIKVLDKRLAVQHP